MQDEPHPPEILAAVARFLRDTVVPATEGNIAYQARVAAAALDLAARELTLAGDAAEAAQLRALLGIDGDLLSLNEELARRLEHGEWDLSTPSVAAHLWTVTRAKLAVDQPKYWGLRGEKEAVLF